MTTPRRATLTLVLALAGCTTSHVLPDAPLEPLEPLAPTPRGTPIRLAPPPALGDCLAAGGALVELGIVDNNDQHDHGALLRFEVAPSGLVAAAGEDGTLKFWTMEAALVGIADPGVLTYGSELGGAPITDLTFAGETAIAGDVRGLVQGLGSAGTASVLSGTDPDVPIAAVAYDLPSGRLAHAQGGPAAPDVLPLIVKTLDGAERWNVTETLDEVRDLAFDVDGRLYVGGVDAGRAALEIRDAHDPTRVVERFSFGDEARLVELASAAEGPTLVAATEHGVHALEGDGVRLVRSSDAALRSVALMPSGADVVSVDDAGEVLVSTLDGTVLARTSVALAVGVRPSPSGDRLVVGSADAHLHVLGCR